MKNRYGLVSIVMPAYNVASTIAESISSVLGQTYDNWELIVVNDGSTDETSSVLSSFLSDKRICVIEQENAGVAAARNRGIKQSAGEFISFLDADDLWIKDKIARQVEMFRSSKDPALGLVYSRYASFSTSLGAAQPRDDDAYYGYLAPEMRIMVYDFIATSTVMTTSTVINDVGLFDEMLLGTEDWDLWIRILSGHSVGLVDDVLMMYRENPQGLSKNFQKHHAEEWKVLKKHVIGNDGVISGISAKALFYHQMKLLSHYCAERQYLCFLKELFMGIKDNPSYYLSPTNIWDVISILMSRHRLNTGQSARTSRVGPS